MFRQVMVLTMGLFVALLVLPRPGFADFEALKADILAGKYETALPELRKIALKDDALAQVFVGDLHMEGRGVIHNPALAYDWYQKAAILDNPDGQYKFALLFLKGQGTPKYPQKAIEWLTKAAGQEHIKATYQLGLIYSRIHGGVKPNRKKAIEWLGKASELGSIEADLALQDVLATDVTTITEVNMDFLEQEEGPPATVEDRIRRHAKKWISALNAHMQGAQIYPRGMIKVTNKGDGAFETEIPGFKIVQPEGNIGITGKLSLTITPEGDLVESLGDYASYKFSGRLPTAILMRPKSEEEKDIHVTMTPKKLEGRWLTALSSFEALDLVIEEIRISDAENDRVMNIKAVTVGSHMEQQADGRWNGRPLEASFAGISATTQSQGVLFNLDKIGFGVGFTGFDIASWKSMMDAMSDDPFESVSAVMAIASRNIAEGKDPGAKGGISGESIDWHIGGLKVYRLGNKADVDVPPSLSIGELTFSVGASDLDKKHSKFAVALSGNDISGSGSDELKQYQSLVPGRLKMDIVVEDVPTWQLAALLVSQMEKQVATLDPVVKQSKVTLKAENIGPLREKALAILSAAGTRFNLEVDSRAELSTLSLNGSLKASQKAKKDFFGGVNITMTGLKLAMAAYEKGKQLPFASMLPIISRMAETEILDDGKEVSKLNIKLGLDGKILINGTDAEKMMMGPQTQ